jgi:hypothetical protein
MDDFPDRGVGEQLAHPWRDVAVRLYANWLATVAAERGTGALLGVGGGAAAPSHSS